MKDELIKRLKDGEHIKDVIADLKVPNYVAFIWAREAGCLNSLDAISIATHNQKVGVGGEALFEKLVPDAMNMNATIEKNHKGYDFDYKGIKIDVKTSTINKTGGWFFRYDGKKSGADVYVMFALDESKVPNDNTIVLLLPTGLAPRNYISVRKSQIYSRFKDFVVPQEKLQEMLDLIVA